ncbi:hypothetical protein [Kordia sp.]|nr:hypothetical protein [Kordia sp.]MCH2196309.1 hypothetical protein [Kordia sp.]
MYTTEHFQIIMLPQNIEKAIELLDLALQAVTNSLEKEHLQKKRSILVSS